MRHGESLWNREMRIQGQTESDLSPEGYKQAEQLAERLKDVQFDAIYSSDLMRAYLTAEIINRNHNLKINKHTGLREANFGDWEGILVSEAKLWYPQSYEDWYRDPVGRRPPNGEGIDSVVRRVRGVVDELANVHKNQTVLVVAHGGPIRAMVCSILNLDITAWRKSRIDNASITIFEFTDSRPFLALLNDTCHLSRSS